MKYFFTLFSLLVFSGILAQSSDKNENSLIQSGSYKQTGGMLIKSIIGQTEVLLIPETKSVRFYQDLVWPPVQQPIKPDEIKLNFGKSPKNLKTSLKEDLLFGSLMLLGTVAGMLNHQVIGIDKEIELRTIDNVYSRSGVPVSAKEPEK